MESAENERGEELPRRAGVSSFGIGGVNAHVIIEEYIPEAADEIIPSITPEHPGIFNLSAKTKRGLENMHSSWQMRLIKKHIVT